MGSSRTGTNALKISGKAKEGEKLPWLCLGCQEHPLPGWAQGLAGSSCLQQAEPCPRERLPCQVAVLQPLEKKGTAKHGRGRQLWLPRAAHSSLCFKE